MPLGNMENLQEERVVQLIREVLQTDQYSHVCKCTNCFIDIAAISLNSLPPEYVADKFYKFPESPEIVEAKRSQALAAIHAAIAKVLSHPHHD